jgi:predicted DNA binding CopG/RHH family protein
MERSVQNMNRKIKKQPVFASEAEERAIWENHDSTDYLDWSKAERATLPNLKPTTQSISLRLPVSLLESLKVAANSRDVPYQSLIKICLNEKLHEAR